MRKFTNPIHQERLPQSKARTLPSFIMIIVTILGAGIWLGFIANGLLYASFSKEMRDLNLTETQSAEIFQVATEQYSANQDGLVLPLGWSLYLEDPFTYNANDWSTTRNRIIDTGRINTTIEDGQFHFRLSVHDALIWHEQCNDCALFRNGQIEVTTQVIDADSDYVAYGLMFRQRRENYYVVLIGQGEKIYAARHRQTDGWHEIIPWQRSSAINSNGSNRLTIRANNDIFNIWINGTHIATFADVILYNGQINLVVYPLLGGNVHVAFDDFSVHSP